MFRSAYLGASIFKNILKFSVRRTYKRLDVTKTEKPDTFLTTDCSFKGQNLVCIRDLSAYEIKQVIWTALEIKKQYQEKKVQVNILYYIIKTTFLKHSYNIYFQPLLKNFRMTMILELRNLHNQIAASMAAKSLGATLSISYEPNLSDVYNNFACLGPILSKNSDLLVIGTRYHSNLEEIAEHATVPIINLTTDFQRPMEAIATLLTLYEHFGHVEGLNVALVGDPNTTFHSYLCSFPRLGVHVRTSCSRLPNMTSPEFFDDATKQCRYSKAILKNCQTTREAVEGADVIIAAPRGESQIEISLEKKFNPNWVFIQNFGSGPPGLNDYFVRHKQSLAFAVIENIMYSYAAVFVMLLCNKSKHSIPESKF